MALRNRFGWSISRESLFDDCRRSYYFHYYLSWGGWKASSPPLRREAFLLKRLNSLPLWRGQLVHYVASKVLESMRRKGRIPAENDVTGYIAERFRKQFAFSESRAYLASPKKQGGRLNIDWLALIDHEYGRGVTDERREKALEECVEGARGLLRSSFLAEIMDTDPAAWVIENIDLAEFAQSFEFEGATVFAKTDFIFRGNDGTYNIVDWKTFSGQGPGGSDSAGQDEGKAGIQMGVYGLFAARVTGEPLEKIRLHEINLLAGGSRAEHRINGGNIDFFLGHVRSGIGKLKGVLAGSDIHRNEPLPPGHFPRNRGERCAGCRFFRICLDPSSAVRLD